MESETSEASRLEPDCAHCNPRDDDFTHRMRVHQSWYRKSVLKLRPGPNPHARGEPYGNMLHEKDGEAGKNFLSAGALGPYA